ncbi:hypothetical protein [Streptomyces sp. SAS_270]|uniref:hypothetical protein n=1 Tax=Streptomyces sp. SAS_270 TaxID=3412748 RepID=UPI00403C0409
MSRKTLARTAVAAALLLSPLSPVSPLSPALSWADDGDGASAQELSDKAQETLLKAKSVHLKLTDDSAGTSTSTTQPTSMDLALDQDGNCTGSIEMGSDGGSVKMVVRDGQVWMKPDKAFWKTQIPGGQGDAAAELFKNRYIHGSTGDALVKGMADSCDLDTFQKEITGDPDNRHTLTKGAETTVDGSKVIPLSYKEAGKKTTLYVSTDDDHHLVEATEKGKGSDLTLLFTDYNEPVPSATPSADESVDISKLQSELQKI